MEDDNKKHRDIVCNGEDDDGVEPVAIELDERHEASEVGITCQAVPSHWITSFAFARKKVVPSLFLKYGTLSLNSSILSGLMSSSIKKRMSIVLDAGSGRVGSMIASTVPLAVVTAPAPGIGVLVGND